MDGKSDIKSDSKTDAKIDAKTNGVGVETKLDIVPVKRFEFDLDKTARQRWEPILKAHEKVLPELKKEIDRILRSMGITDNSWTYWGIQKLVAWYRDRILHADELTYISEATGIAFPKLLLMQLLYEASAACTCVVTNVGGEPTLFRTMDWDMPLLRSITVELVFIRNGRTLFVAPTWVGCVGVFTAHVPGSQGYAVAINYRRTQPLSLTSLAKNLWRLTDMVWPVSYLVRHVAENQMTWPTAIDVLQEMDIVAPCYITLFGGLKGSYVLTRDAKGGALPEPARQPDKKLGLYQTNCDHGKLADQKAENIVWSKERCALITSEVEEHGNNFSSGSDLIASLLRFPVLNDETVYTSVISTHKINTYTNSLRH